jgi:hypothetical protein
LELLNVFHETMAWIARRIKPTMADAVSAHDGRAMNRAPA